MLSASLAPWLFKRRVPPICQRPPSSLSTCQPSSITRDKPKDGFPYPLSINLLQPSSFLPLALLPTYPFIDAASRFLSASRSASRSVALVPSLTHSLLFPSGLNPFFSHKWRHHLTVCGVRFPASRCGRLTLCPSLAPETESSRGLKIYQPRYLRFSILSNNREKLENL
jgi:hypothetical protein